MINYLTDNETSLTVTLQRHFAEHCTCVLLLLLLDSNDFHSFLRRRLKRFYQAIYIRQQLLALAVFTLSPYKILFDMNSMKYEIRHTAAAQRCQL